MAHGVLHERLQREGRRPARERARVDVPRDREPVAVTQLLELEIALRELPLLAEGDGLAGVLAQRLPENVAELLDGSEVYRENGRRAGGQFERPF